MRSSKMQFHTYQVSSIFGSFAAGLVLLLLPNKGIAGLSPIVCAEVFSETSEMTVPEESLLRNKRVDESNFQTHRSFGVIADNFRDFDFTLTQAVSNLNGSGHIIDFGAGEMRAVADLSKRSASLFVTGITMVPVNAKGEFKHRSDMYGTEGIVSYRELLKLKNVNPLIGRYFEQIPLSEILGKFGPADIAIDSFGIVSYSRHPLESLEKMSHLIKPGGLFFISHLNALFLDMFNLPTGESVTLIQLLEKSEAFELVDYKRGNHGVFRRTDKAWNLNR